MFPTGSVNRVAINDSINADPALNPFKIELTRTLR
jgi:hypothetical protein